MFATLAHQMRALDRRAIDNLGIPGVVLMDNAGRSVAEEAKSMLEGKEKKVVILVGAGNNGGDGLVAARYLFEWGFSVKVWLLNSEDKIKGDARINLEIAKKILSHQDIIEVIAEDGFLQQIADLNSADLVIDSILGTGIQGNVTGIKREIIIFLNSLEKKVLAVDIPSGLDADTGKLLGCCVRANRTVTFALPKVGLLVYPGAEYSGEIKVVDIGIPSILVKEANLTNHYLSQDLVREWLPTRKPTAHKGIAGRVLIIAGSRGMAGAAVLAAQGVLKAGAGLVFLAVPESIYPLVGSQLREVMVWPLKETKEGTLALSAWIQLEKLLNQADALVVGPGLSSNEETSILVLKILDEISKPIVVDADGLNILAKNKQFLAKIKNHLILTPHPGEFARLIGQTIGQIEENRLELTKEKAKEWGVTLVLKGARTLVAADDGNIYINPTGNAGMATAGSGDVLAGVIGGLLAQGMEKIYGASAGVYLHGLAGDLALVEQGELGLTAGDILHYLPKSIKLVKEGDK